MQYPQTAFLEPGWILSLFARPAVIVLLILIGMPRRHRRLRTPPGKYHSRLSRLPSHSTSFSPSTHVPPHTLVFLLLLLIVILLIFLMLCLLLLLYILAPLHTLLPILLVLFLFCLIVVTAVLCSVPLCGAMFCVAMLCDSMLHYAMPHHAMTCYALPCSSAPCYAVLYHASRTFLLLLLFLPRLQALEGRGDGPSGTVKPSSSSSSAQRPASRPSRRGGL